jgi:hypothetical protein
MGGGVDPVGYRFIAISIIWSIIQRSTGRKVFHKAENGEKTPGLDIPETRRSRPYPGGHRGHQIGIRSTAIAMSLATYQKPPP